MYLLDFFLKNWLYFCLIGCIGLIGFVIDLSINKVVFAEENITLSGAWQLVPKVCYHCSPSGLIDCWQRN